MNTKRNQADEAFGRPIRSGHSPAAFPRERGAFKEEMMNNNDATLADPELQRFERWSKKYDQSPLQRLYFGRVQKAVLDLVPRYFTPRVVLDVGCGTGRLLRAARKRWLNARFIGVDVVPGMIEAARRLDPLAVYHNAPAEALPVSDASAGVALSTVSFHHWSDQAAGLREIRRVLAPDGYLVLADEHLPEWLRLLYHGRRGTHPAPLRLPELRAALARAGFRVIKWKKIVFGSTVVCVCVRP